MKLLKRGSDCTTYSDLRVELFHFSKCGPIHILPPTSEGLLPHTQRAFYNALETHCNPGTVVQSKPEDFWYEHDQGLLLPTSSWKNLEVHWSVLCSCEKRAKSSCPCRMAEVKCRKFCQCKKHSSHACKNPFT